MRAISTVWRPGDIVVQSLDLCGPLSSLYNEEVNLEQFKQCDHFFQVRSYVRPHYLNNKSRAALEARLVQGGPATHWVSPFLPSWGPLRPS